MGQKTKNDRKRFLASETGAICKSWKNNIRVVLAYPNRYGVGMSNLGFQTVYRQINAIHNVLCERVFLPEQSEPAEGPVRALESGKPISQFHIVAFSISYENDFPNILRLLQMAEIPLRSADRGISHPLILAGGVAGFLNPEPISPFIDCFLLGEAEALIPGFFQRFDPAAKRAAMLKTIACKVPGAYIPQFYEAAYDAEDRFLGVQPIADVPDKIERRYAENLSEISTTSTILTGQTTFENTFLVELGRGCTRGCRFCTAGFVYRPPRPRPADKLAGDIALGLSKTDRIGLVGAAIADHPGIAKLCQRFHSEKARISFSSLRADALSPALLSTLKQSRVKTATIAPDAGSQRMRDVINKGLSEADILDAAEILVAEGIPNLKLYFMVGLPTETRDDVSAIIDLCKRIKHRFLKSSRTRKRIGEITVSLNCFVPKPFTPFQWAAMDDIQTLKQKIKKIKTGLRRAANVRVHSDVPRWAYIQGLLSRGDRKAAQILLLAHQNRENWAATLKHTPINPDYYALRKRPLTEPLPWDFIDHGIDKSFLATEYHKALEARTSPPCPMGNCTLCGVCK